MYGKLLIPVTPKTFPKLWAATKALADEAEVAMPLFFIMHDDDGYASAHEHTWAHRVGMITLSSNELRNSGDDTARWTFAQMLGHYKHRDESRGALAVLAAALSQLALAWSYRGSICAHPIKSTVGGALLLFINYLLFNKMYRYSSQAAVNVAGAACDPRPALDWHRALEERIQKQGLQETTWQHLTSMHPTNAQYVKQLEALVAA